MVTVLRFPEDNQVKVYHVPSEAGPSAAERLFTQALNRTHLAKSGRAGYLPVAEWTESVIPIMLWTENRGLCGETTASRLQ